MGEIVWDSVGTEKNLVLGSQTLLQVFYSDGGGSSILMATWVELLWVSEMWMCSKKSQKYGENIYIYI